jgi:hypothetical protein
LQTRTCVSYLAPSVPCMRCSTVFTFFLPLLLLAAANAFASLLFCSFGACGTHADCQGPEPAASRGG